MLEERLGDSMDSIMTDEIAELSGYRLLKNIPVLILPDNGHYIACDIGIGLPLNGIGDTPDGARDHLRDIIIEHLQLAEKPAAPRYARDTAHRLNLYVQN